MHAGFSSAVNAVSLRRFVRCTPLCEDRMTGLMYQTCTYRAPIVSVEIATGDKERNPNLLHAMFYRRTGVKVVINSESCCDSNGSKPSRSLKLL